MHHDHPPIRSLSHRNLIVCPDPGCGSARGRVPAGHAAGTAPRPRRSRDSDAGLPADV